MGRFDRPSFRSNNRPSFRDNRDKQMYDATCADCGKSCQVPFRPSGEKPVYCGDCFRNHRDTSDRRPAPFRRPPSNESTPQFIDQFKKLNSKLDQIIDLITKESRPQQFGQDLHVEKEKKSAKKSTEPKVITIKSAKKKAKKK